MPDRPTVTIRFSAAEIATRVDEMAAELAAKLPADTLVVSVLKGSFVFAADLIRALSRAGADWSMDFLDPVELRHRHRDQRARAHRARHRRRRARARRAAGRRHPGIGPHARASPRSCCRSAARSHVSICTLLDKPGKRRTQLEADFVGFQCRRRVPGRLRPRLGPPLPRPAVYRGGREDGLADQFKRTAGLQARSDHDAGLEARGPLKT